MGIGNEQELVARSKAWQPGATWTNRIGRDLAGESNLAGESYQRLNEQKGKGGGKRERPSTNQGAVPAERASV